jgi:hypothetical protein
VQAERGEDPVLQLAPERRTGGRLDGEAEQDVVGVGVGEGGPRREQRRVRHRDADQLCRPPHQGGVGRHGWPEAGVVGVVEDPAGVLEQLAQGDGRAAWHQAGKPPCDAVAESQPVLGRQLQHHRGDERLGEAARPDPVARGHRASGGDVRQPAGRVHQPVAEAGQADDARDAVVGDALQRRPERCLGRRSLRRHAGDGRPRRRQSGDNDGQGGRARTQHAPGLPGCYQARQPAPGELCSFRLTQTARNSWSPETPAVRSGLQAACKRARTSAGRAPPVPPQPAAIRRRAQPPGHHERHRPTKNASR